MKQVTFIAALSSMKRAGVTPACEAAPTVPRQSRASRRVSFWEKRVARPMATKYVGCRTSILRLSSNYECRSSRCRCLLDCRGHWGAGAGAHALLPGRWPRADQHGTRDGGGSESIDGERAPAAAHS